ncbi:Uncharacterised protein [Mycobacteroides abscessus subsp. abscessus]|nr:Uncharacterised protein [Mycobacteroides abscessus subsp. abscessus]
MGAATGPGIAGVRVSSNSKALSAAAVPSAAL